jgi:anion-transporting  ArsA/GET3 family ATPase
MTDFVGGSLLRWFAKPYTSAGKLGVRAFNITASPFLRIADRVLGSQVLEDLSEFVLDFQTLYDDFKRRATDVLALLRRDITGFVVVTTLEGPPLGEATFFIDRLVDEGMPLAGIVANKVIPQRFASEEAAAEIRRLDDLDPQTISVPVDAFEDVRTSLVTLHDLAVRDRDRLAELRRRARSAVAPVPLLTSDVHDLEGLERLAGYALGD